MYKVPEWVKKIGIIQKGHQATIAMFSTPSMSPRVTSFGYPSPLCPRIKSDKLFFKISSTKNRIEIAVKHNKAVHELQNGGKY